MSETSTAVRVLEAKQQLEAAQRAQAEEQREKDLALLADVRRQLRKAEHDYQHLAARVRREDAILAQKQNKVNQVVQLIESSMAMRPSVADILPDDPEVVEWKGDHDRLIELRDEAIRARETFRSTCCGHNEAAKFEDTGAGPGIVTRLKRQEANLIEKLQGKKPGGGWEGGLNYVG